MPSAPPLWPLCVSPPSPAPPITSPPSAIIRSCFPSTSHWRPLWLPFAPASPAPPLRGSLSTVTYTCYPSISSQRPPSALIMTCYPCIPPWRPSSVITCSCIGAQDLLLFPVSAPATPASSHSNSHPLLAPSKFSTSPLPPNLLGLLTAQRWNMSFASRDIETLVTNKVFIASFVQMLPAHISGPTDPGRHYSQSSAATLKTAWWLD